MYDVVSEALRERLGLAAGESLFFSYQHLAEMSPLDVNQTVQIGAVVGGVGNTGNSTGGHLHLEIRKGESNSLGYTYFGVEDGTMDTNSNNRLVWEGMSLVDPNKLWYIPTMAEVLDQ